MFRISGYISDHYSRPLLQCISMESFIETSSRRLSSLLASLAKLITNRNFLYDVNRERGVLVDFGLAEVRSGEKVF